MIFNGSANGLIIINEQGQLTDPPVVRLRGVIDQDQVPDIKEQLEKEIVERHYNLSKKLRLDDKEVEEAARRAIRRVIRRLCGRRPVTDVHVVRIEEIEDE